MNTLKLAVLALAFAFPLQGMSAGSDDAGHGKDYRTFHADGTVALESVNLSIFRNEILGLMGPSRSGKTTLLRNLNRMADSIEGARREGSIYLDGENIFSRECDPDNLRRLLAGG